MARHRGKAVAGAIDAGGNAVRVSGIKLEVGDTDALLARARDAALPELRPRGTGRRAAGAQGHRDQGRSPGRVRHGRDCLAAG